MLFRSPKHENSYQKLQRSRESEVWGRVVELVGPPAEGVHFVHVFDRGADNLDVFCHCRAQRTDGVIRAAQWQRVVEEAGNEETEERDGAQRLSLRAVLMKQPLSGTYHDSARSHSCPLSPRSGRERGPEMQTCDVVLRAVGRRNEGSRGTNGPPASPLRAGDHSSSPAADEIPAPHRLPRN